MNINNSLHKQKMNDLRIRIIEQKNIKDKIKEESLKIEKEIADLKVEKSNINKDISEKYIRIVPYKEVDKIEPFTIIQNLEKYILLKKELQQILENSTKDIITTTIQNFIDFSKEIYAQYQDEQIKSNFGICCIKNKMEVTQNKIIGDAYECFVGLVYQEKGFNIKYNGILKGKYDDGIDLVATKDDTVVLVQCKYRSKKNQIKQYHLKAFAYDFKVFSKKEDYYLRKINHFGVFTVPNKSTINYGSYIFLKVSENFINYDIQDFAYFFKK